MANIFQKITKEMMQVGYAVRNYNSITWFRKNIENLFFRNKQRARIEKMTTPAIGKMFLMSYSPKHWKTLPYYDIYPLIFIVKFLPDGFLAINLHYLGPPDRALLMNELLKIDTNNDKMDESTRLKLSFKVLTRMAHRKRASVCIKRYLYSNIHNIGMIPSSEWINAMGLPLEGFRRKSSRKDRRVVWEESSKKIKGQ